MKPNKVIDFNVLSTLRSSHHGRRIVQCHGVFDVLHAGHLAYLRSAKNFGDVLVVTLTADEHVNKGPGRPYFSANVRAAMLAAMEIVDYVAVNKSPTAVPAIEALKPDFYVKGPDYKNMAKDVTGGIYAEERAVQAHGGKLVFTEDDIYSSSELLNKFFSSWTEEQVQAIDAVKKAGGLPLIESILEKVKALNVVVIGEPIVDTYVFCTAEGISSKSPSVSAKFLYQEDYLGGSLAIANHLSDFARSVTLLTTHGGEKYFQQLLDERLGKRVSLDAIELSNIPTPRKTRYIDESHSQRLFELTDLRSDQWKKNPPRPFIDRIFSLNKSSDVTLIADFGHGLFENSVLDSLRDLQGFIGLNVQTNSSNFGYNPFTKHRRFSFLSIDNKEARVAYHDRFSASRDLLVKIRNDLDPIQASVAMTLGPQGSIYFPYQPKGENRREYSVPAFANRIVDATGAGDAFFALASMLIKVDCPPEVVPFLANIFAGLKANIIGNKASVKSSQLMKAVTSILK